MTNLSTQDKFLKFLQEKEHEDCEFSAKDVADAVGWNIKTYRSYFNKYLNGVCVARVSRDSYKAFGTKVMTSADMSQTLSQKATKVSSLINDEYTTMLRDRSVESALLAIDLYNRPSLKNRVEAFCIWMTNAWELLFKAKIVIDHGRDSIYSNKEKTHTISLIKAAMKCISSKNDPEFINVSLLSDIRDNAVHLLVSEMNVFFAGLFRRSVHFYMERFTDIFDYNPLPEDMPGLISIYDNRNVVDINILGIKYGNDVQGQCEKLLSQFEKYAEDESIPNEFSVDVNHHLVLIKKSKGKADVTLTVGDGGANLQKIEIPKDPEKTHPLMLDDLVNEVNSILKTKGINNKITRNNVYQIRHYEGFTKSPNEQYVYYYKSFNRWKYSHDFAELIANSIETKVNYLDNCKASYKRR